MPEHYDAETLRVSRRLYEDIRTWGQGGGVTLIGGWAVHERVDPLVAQQSRDVDLVIHDETTLLAFDQRLKGWGLQWRRHGRNRFNDCHLIDDESRTIRVDVFKASPFEERLFKGPRMHGAPLVKRIPTTDWLPSVEFLILDKLSTIPLRLRDRDDKRLKDFIDLHNLAFHNRDGISARTLAEATTAGRAGVLEFLGDARRHDEATRGSAYAEVLDAVESWLRT